MSQCGNVCFPAPEARASGPDNGTVAGYHTEFFHLISPPSAAGRTLRGPGDAEIPNTLITGRFPMAVSKNFH